MRSSTVNNQQMTSSSLYSKYSDAASGQTPTKQSPYQNSQNSNYTNTPTSLAEQKSARYIKYLKEQNVQLKQQLDQERQQASLYSSGTPPNSMANPSIPQMKVHQLQIQYTTLQNDYDRYKSDAEAQQKERLNQIENLLREKQKFISEKEKLSNENRQLSIQVEELKKSQTKFSPSEREQQLKIENSKIRAENSKLRAETDEVRAEQEVLNAEKEKLQQQVKQLQNEINKLKKQRVSQAATTTATTKHSSRKESAQPTAKKVDTPSKTPQPRKSSVDSRQSKANQDKLVDLQAKVQVLTQQLKDKTNLLDEVRAENAQLKKSNDELTKENHEVNEKHQKLMNENGILSATIIRQKNDLDAKKKDINNLTAKQTKIKKLLKVVSNIRNTNAVLAQRNRELEQKVLDSQTSTVTPPSSPRQVFSVSTTHDDTSDKAITKLSEKIENLIQKVTYDSATKSQQIDDLGKKISQISETQRSLSETVGTLQSHLVDSSLKDIDPSDLSSSSMSS